MNQRTLCIRPIMNRRSHGGESHAFNDVLTREQNLPGAAKDVVRKVLDVRYR